MKENQSFDTKRAENFANSLIDTLNKSALSFMISIGHRSGLYDTMANMEFFTPGELAASSNLNERYVREWLGAMVTGGTVEYSSETKKYSLPAEHSAFLTRRAGADNMSVFMKLWLKIAGSRFYLHLKVIFFLLFRGSLKQACSRYPEQLVCCEEITNLTHEKHITDFISDIPD